MSADRGNARIASALVVVAHPVPDAFTHAIARRVIDTLTADGASVAVHDLYADGFRAAMSATERADYHGAQPISDPLVIRYAADLAAADTIVFVYPTWWSGLPAILKGWFDRVLGPGVAFRFDHRGRIRPGATHIRRVIGISTYGSPWLYVRLVNDNGRRTISRALRPACGLRTRVDWCALYEMDTVDTEKGAAFLDRVEQMLRSPGGLRSRLGRKTRDKARR